MPNKHRRDRRNFTKAMERPLLLDGEPEAPAVVVHRLLKSAQRDRANAVNAVREESRQQVQRQRDRHVALAWEVAATLHELRGLLDRHQAPMRGAGLDAAPDALAALHRRLAKVLQSTGVRMIDPVGEPYPAVADYTDVKGRPGGTADAGLVVAKTISPGLLLDDGELVRPAEVFLEPAGAADESAGQPASGQPRQEGPAEGEPPGGEPAATPAAEQDTAPEAAAEQHAAQAAAGKEGGTP